MVDAKAYKRNVDSPQIDKIKSDLRRNNHIHFAWLVFPIQTLIKEIRRCLCLNGFGESRVVLCK